MTMNLRQSYNRNYGNPKETTVLLSHKNFLVNINIKMGECIFLCNWSLKAVMLRPQGQISLEAKILASASTNWSQPRAFGLGLVNLVSKNVLSNAE